MPPKVERLGQRELLQHLRFAIDTAMTYPQRPNIQAALELAREHPQGMRSGHIKHLLGAGRWIWLAEHGFVAVGEPTEIAGMSAMKGTIEPEVIK